MHFTVLTQETRLFLSSLTFIRPSLCHATLLETLVTQLNSAQCLFIRQLISDRCTYVRQFCTRSSVSSSNASLRDPRCLPLFPTSVFRKLRIRHLSVFGSISTQTRSPSPRQLRLQLEQTQILFLTNRQTIPVMSLQGRSFSQTSQLK